MADFIVIHNNKVTNYIVADDREIAELVTGGICIERTEGLHVTIDDIYDPETNTFSKPVVVAEDNNDADNA
jgi:hypothetical protein